MGPYKYKFSRVFRKMINNSKPYKNVLDIACADAKFRDFFGQTKYTGIDISKKKLSSKKAIKKVKMFANTKLIVGDITNFSSLKLKNKFDLVVSTHTIYLIKDVKKKIAIHNLIKSIDHNGHLIIQLKNECFQNLEKILSNKLTLLEHIVYKGKLSDFLENKLSDKFHLSFFGKLINIICSYIDFGKTSENLLLYKKK
jgi:hypothetical protein